VVPCGRLQHRRPGRNAGCPLATYRRHSIPVTAYDLLSRQTTYQDLRADYFDRRHAERVTRRAIHVPERRGYRVRLEPAASTRGIVTGIF